MSQVQEVLEAITAQGEAWQEFKTANNARLSIIENELSIKTRQDARAKFSPASDTNQLEKFIDTKSGKSIPVLAHADKLASLEQKQNGAPSMGRLLRGIVLGGKAVDANELAEERKALGIGADPTGGYTVNGALSNEWIDALRANMVLSKAGVRCIPMDTATLSLAKVLTSPTCSWHAENALLGTGDPSFGQVQLVSKTVTCLVRLSLELAQDSANIEQILQSTITNSMAAAIDKAGLVGATTDTAGTPQGVMNMANRSKVTAIGAPTNYDWLVDGMFALAASNVPLENVGAFIAHPKVWQKLRKMRTGIASDMTPLEMPEEIALLPKLWTTAMPLTGGTTAAGVIGDWRDLVMGCRRDISVRVLSEAFMGSNLQMAILAYARVDFAATRQESFCTLEGLTV